MDGNKYKSYTAQKNNVNKVKEIYKSSEGINPTYTILYNSGDEIQPYLAFVKPDYMPQNLEGDILAFNEELIAVFYLSKEEFSWVNSDKNQLNDLVLSMHKFLPKDRINNIVVHNKVTNQSRQCTLNLTCDTMDNKLYEKKVGVELLTEKEKVYVIYCNETGENVPAIGGNEEVRICAQEDWARRYVTNNNDDVSLFYKEIAICELKKRIIDWFAEGITKYVFEFIDEKIIDIDLEILFEADSNKPKKYHGSSLDYLMIRFRQYNTNKKSRGMVSMAQTMFSAFCHELPKTLLLVPVLYDNENRFTANNDLGLHTTINAQKILLDINAKNFVYNHIENKDELEDNEKGRFIIEKDGNPIYVHMNGEKIIEFLGSDEYDVADKPGGEGCMHFCTVKSPQGKPALPAFTNLNDLKRIYGNTVHIGLATYDDLINEINNGSVLNGIVFNPSGISLFIAKDELVLVEKEMQEKPEIYIPNFNNTDKQRKGDPSKEFEGIYSSKLSEKILRTHVNFEKIKRSGILV